MQRGISKIGKKAAEVAGAAGVAQAATQTTVAEAEKGGSAITHAATQTPPVEKDWQLLCAAPLTSEECGDACRDITAFLSVRSLVKSLPVVALFLIPHS